MGAGPYAAKSFHGGSPSGMGIIEKSSGNGDAGRSHGVRAERLPLQSRIFKTGDFLKGGHRVFSGGSWSACGDGVNQAAPTPTRIRRQQTAAMAARLKNPHPFP